MSLGLTKPGLHATLHHPKTGAAIVPLGYRKNGMAIWPIVGASPDDPDDPAFTDPGGKIDDDDDDESDDDADPDDDEDEDDKKSKKKPKKDEDEDDDFGALRSRQARQAAKYRTDLRAAEKANEDLNRRLRAIEDRDKKPDEVVTRDLTEARSQVDKLTETVRDLRMENAWHQANTIEWADRDDALAAARRLGLLDDIVENDGTVDTKALRAALRELARKKPHLVKKASNGRASAKDDEDQDDEDQASSAPPMNGRRKGTRGNTDRAALAKRFPVLRP